MKRVLIHIGLITLFSAPFLYKASAQEEEETEQPLQGEAYKAPSDYPHVDSVQELQMNKIIDTQQEAIKKQNEMLQKLSEGEQGVAPPGEGEGAVAPTPPEKVTPPSSAISEESYKCRHVTITMPEDINCGYLITTGAAGKSANILMLEASQMRKGQCLLEIDCEKPTTK